MSTPDNANVAALAMVIRSSLSELRNVAGDMARNPKGSLSRLTDEASVLSGALQRLDKALDDGGNGSLPSASAEGIKTPDEIARDPEASAKYLVALDRIRRWAMPGGRCPACGGVL